MYILRRDCLEHATNGWPPGRFLEIGAGTGHLTRGFLERGFTGVCYDLGAGNRDVLRRNLAFFGSNAQVVDDLGVLGESSFDYLFAFEVLEHIDGDFEALRSWVRLLKPGGRILLSVPAHMSKYNEEDRAVGHVRRYEREQLAQLIIESGCGGPHLLSYGFPLAIITRRGNQCLSLLRGTGAAEAGGAEALSIRSGVERSHASVRLARFLNRRTLAPFVYLQRLFFHGDLGDGYVAYAFKTGGNSMVSSAT